MENQSQDQAHRRHRGNRSSGRSRNRQSKSSQSRAEGSNRSRSRSRGRSGRSKPPKQTPLQRFLSLITFGWLGQPKSKARGKGSPRSAKTAPAAPVRAAKESDRKPKRNRSEVVSNRLYVGNLAYSTGETELEELFRGVGNVLSAEVVTNPRTQQSKGFAFVEMGSLDEAKRAVAVLDDEEFMGRRLIVSGARSEGAAGAEEGEESLLSEAPVSDRI